ncbi:MAG: GNAT family N-acetyltransferase [Betaproteobacteria bacterium]
MPMRIWRPQDLDASIEVFQRAVHEIAVRDYTLEELRAWAPEPPDVAAWSRLMEDLKAWTCEIRGRIAGFIASDRPGHIQLLYVHPDFQRMGVATALLDTVIADAGLHGVHELSTESSRTGRRFFEQAGFSVQREEQASRNGVSLQRYVMTRPLA